MLERIAKWYRQGLWTKKMVQDAVRKKVFTQAQAEQILGVI